VDHLDLLVEPSICLKRKSSLPGLSEHVTVSFGDWSVVSMVCRSVSLTESSRTEADDGKLVIFVIWEEI